MNEQEELSEKMFSQMRDLGYDSHNAVIGMGEPGFFVVLHLIMFCLYFMLFRPLNLNNSTVRRNSCYKYFYFEYKRRTIFYDILTVGIECSIEIFICCYYNFVHPIKILSGDIFSLFFSYYCITMMSITLVLCLWVITKNR